MRAAGSKAASLSPALCSHCHSGTGIAKHGREAPSSVFCCVFMLLPAGPVKGKGGSRGDTEHAPRVQPRCSRGVVGSGSNHFQKAFVSPALAGVSPPPELICMALPLPRCHWSVLCPAHCPSTKAGFCPPSYPEVRAAGGLLNRGGGSRDKNGARSGEESAAPWVGEAGGQLEITSAAPTTAGPKVRRRRGARAPQQASGPASQRRGVGLLCWGWGLLGEERAEKTAG